MLNPNASGAASERQVASTTDSREDFERRTNSARDARSGNKVLRVIRGGEGSGASTTNNNTSRPALLREYARKQLASLTPNPRDYKEKVYPTKDVDRDINLLGVFRRTPEYKKGEEFSDAVLLERAFTQMVEKDDWFGEYGTYNFNDPRTKALVTVPTSDVDDAFNHIDVIGMFKNEATGYEAMPFAVDLTYNTDYKKMQKKFEWKHVYGKKKTAPEGVSEFGDSYMDKDDYGRDTLKTRPLQMKFRFGLKIPGFASAKYFEDKSSLEKPMYEKGRIDIMPRFIVGYSTDITDVLASGKPNKKAYKGRDAESAYRRDKAKYEEAGRRAKWCALIECSRQASQIRSMLENLNEEETKWMRPEELEKAKKQITVMDNYFKKAFGLSDKKAQEDPGEMAAKKYAEKDKVCQEILSHSGLTYVDKIWKKDKRYNNVSSRRAV